QHTRDSGQRLEMIGAGAFRREQQEDETDRLPVERFEIDRPFQPCKQAEQLVELRKLAVRYRDAVADSGGAELFALHQRFENRLFAMAGNLRGLGGKLLQRLLLAVDPQRRNDRIERDNVGKRHGTFSRIETLRTSEPPHQSRACRLKDESANWIVRRFV